MSDDKSDVEPITETPPVGDESTVQTEAQEQESPLNTAIITVITPFSEKVELGPVSLLENGSFIRQNLTEFYETCSYTHYNIECGVGADAVAMNDFVELMNYISPTAEEEEAKSPIEVTLRMTLADYGEKTAMSHVKRFHELMMFPPGAKALLPAKDDSEVPETDSGDSNASASETEGEVAARKEKAKNNLPKMSTFLNEDVSLQSFYENVLYSVGGAGEENKDTTLSDSIQNVSYSGWNPPPFSRSTAGDLCYFEVRTASNSVIHITAIAGGFYVNNCTLNHFDPTPAEKAHFSHELLYTLAGANAPFKLQWESLGSKLESTEKPATVSNTSANALQSIAALYQKGRGDFTFQSPQWHAQASSSGGKCKRAIDTKHKYDSSRAQIVLADAFGIEEKGVPREWNEEIQSIRALPAKNTSEQIMKSRFIYRTTSEFTESCRQTVIAISKGHIVPVNPMDTEENQVYIYNNIFFSRSIDTKEAFKVCTGDEASRKSAAQDFKNQKLLHSFGIEGLSSVLCTVVDFMGQRFVGQSIIPGILQQANESAARLMYGALDEGMRLKCKTEALDMMHKIGEKMQLAERNILATPALHLNGDAPATSNATQPDSMLNFLNGSDGTQSPSIKIDDDDETVPADAKVISHMGPLEGKLLKGSDNRLYVLEVNRLTPLDANFVQKSKGGSGNVTNLGSVDPEVCMTYCLRQELLQEYVNTETMTLRQNELQALLAKLKVEDKADEEKEEKALEDSEKAESSEEKGEGSEVATTEKKEKTEEEKEEEEKRVLASQIPAEDIERITKLETNFLFNPNCFLGDYVLCKENADDVSVLAKDEELARDLANFLWTKSLPNLNTMIRIGNYVTQDGKGITDLMHARGVNMRYLGQLAVLADEAEASDRKLNDEGKIMKNPMPHYWLEMLVIEILARSMKHLLNSYLRSNKAIRASPAVAVTSLLNLLLAGSSLFVEEGMENGTESSSSGNKKNKNKKINAEKSKSSGHVASVSTVPDTYKAPLNKEQFWSKITKIAESKFLYQGQLLVKHELSPRISRSSLLRRVSQMCGLRMLCKDYDFTSTKAFIPTDLQEMYPLVKSSEPLVVFAGGHNLLQAAMNQLQSGNHGMAYELAQEASKWMGQVTGPVHTTTCQAIEIMASVLVQYGDNEVAIGTMSKKLTLDVQLYGLDCNEAMQGHVFLGTMYHEVNNFEAAVAHLQSALYILRLMAGSHHPEIANIYFRLALIYHDVGDHASSLSLLDAAQKLTSSCGDLAKNAPIFQTMSNVYAAINNFKDAIITQKQCWNLNRQLYGEEDQRAEAAKNRLAVLIRENAEYNVKQLQDKADRERSEKVNRASSSSLWLDDDLTSKKKKAGSKKKSKKKATKAATSENQDW